MLSGIIAGALGGGAAAANQLADNAIKRDNTRFESELQAEREAQRARLAESIRREGVLWGTTGPGGEATRAAARLQIEETAPAQAAADAARETAVGGARRENRRLDIPVDTERERAVVTARESAQTQAETERNNNPDYLRGRQRVTDAGVSSTSKAESGERVATSSEERAERKELSDLRRAAASAQANNNPEGVAAIEGIIARRFGSAAVGGKGDSNYDTVKTITETDPVSGEPKTRTEITRRVPRGQGGASTSTAADPLGLRGGAAPAPAGASSAPQPAPQKEPVPGRPYYDTPRDDLLRMARKPRGVSSAEAAAAAAELEARKTDQRMSGF